MRIAVVDDESIFRMQLEMMCSKIAAKKELSLDVEQFESGESFLAVLDDRRFDIVFLDILMPDMDGITVAKKLREMTERTFLIFMTASDDHYADAFSVHAFDYVVKPFTIDKIEKVVDEIIEHTPMDEAFVKLPTSPLEKKLYLREIVCATTDGHYLDITSVDEEVNRVRMTAKEFLELTGNDDRLITVNRGIIVNMDFVDKVESGDVTLKNGLAFPISSKKITLIVQQMNAYKFSNK